MFKTPYSKKDFKSFASTIAPILLCKTQDLNLQSTNSRFAVGVFSFCSERKYDKKTQDP